MLSSRFLPRTLLSAQVHIPPSHATTLLSRTSSPLLSLGHSAGYVSLSGAPSSNKVKWRYNDQPPRIVWKRETDAMSSTLGKKIHPHPHHSFINPSSLVNCHLQVIGTGSCEMSPSFCLFTDSRRYLFNCGENFQRYTREYRMKILKEPTLFITHVSWRNLGGLPGFAMSYRDCGKTYLRIHGPGRIAQFAEVTRYFVGREKLRLVTNYESTPVPNDGSTVSGDVYSDENVTITTVELESQTEMDTQITDKDVASSLDADDVMGERSDVPNPKRVKLEGEPSLPASTAAFICKLVDTKGKFNPERAKELGLQKGPIYKKLVNGESVTAPDGRVIHPSDVIGAKQIGPTFIVVECPSTDYIASLVSNPKLQGSYFSDLGQNLALVIHLSPVEVL